MADAAAPADDPAGPPRTPLFLLSCVARAVACATGWRRAAIAVAAGAVSVLAFAPFFLWGVLFLTLPVLVWLVDGAVSRGRAAPPYRLAGNGAAAGAAAAGWLFGFGFFFAGLFWIGEAFLVEAERFAWALPFAVTLLPAGLALFWAGAAAAAGAVWRGGPARVLALALALSAAEWLRGHLLTGFPWNVLGYALTHPLPLMQAAAVGGIYSLTLLAVALFAAPLVVLADPPPRLRGPGACAAALLLAAAPLTALWLYGWSRLAAPGPTADYVEAVRFRLVQPSVPQREKWRPEKFRDNFVGHLELSLNGADGKRDDLAGITHVLWPEAAMPFLPLDTPQALQAIADLLPEGASLMTGALRVERDGARPAGRQGFNSLLVLDADGRLAALYDKIHLVPFGEYLPLRPLLERIGLEVLTRWRGGFSPGPQPRPLLRLPGLPPAAVLICYEAIFPGEVVQGGERPQVLVNVTNDGWFGNTTGPHQHFHQARVRAVEEGLPLLRAANNGISGVIDPQGRVLARLELNARGTIDTGLPKPLAPPLYARYGDWLFALAWLVVLAIFIALPRAGKMLAAGHGRGAGIGGQRHDQPPVTVDGQTGCT